MSQHYPMQQGKPSSSVSRKKINVTGDLLTSGSDDIELKRENLSSKSWSQKWIHIIPLIVLFCLFILWICLGILQFLDYDQQDVLPVLVKRECASDFASTIADVIKQDGHIIHNFSLEVSLPQFIMENEKSVLPHIKKKYHSELWYQKIVRSELISIKDVLKLSLTNPLETLLRSQLEPAH